METSKLLPVKIDWLGRAYVKKDGKKILLTTNLLPREFVMIEKKPPFEWDAVDLFGSFKPIKMKFVLTGEFHLKEVRYAKLNEAWLFDSPDLWNYLKDPVRS